MTLSKDIPGDTNPIVFGKFFSVKVFDTYFSLNKPKNQDFSLLFNFLEMALSNALSIFFR